MICMVCMIAPKDGILQTMHSRKIMQIMHFMPSAPLPTRKQTVKKVPTGRHARTVGTHTGKLSAESVRGHKAECAVQRSILSPGGYQGEGISVPRMRAEMGSPWSVSLLRHADAVPVFLRSASLYAPTLLLHPCKPAQNGVS